MDSRKGVALVSNSARWRERARVPFHHSTELLQTSSATPKNSFIHSTELLQTTFAPCTHETVVRGSPPPTNTCHGIADPLQTWGTDSTLQVTQQYLLHLENRFSLSISLHRNPAPPKRRSDTVRRYENRCTRNEALRISTRLSLSLSDSLSTTGNTSTQKQQT